MSVIEKDLDPDTFIGLQLPLGVHQDGVFKQTQTLLEQTKSSIRNLLLTRRGERLGNPTFGTNLLSVVFTQENTDLESRVEEEIIRGSIREFLPFVTVNEITFSTSENTIRPRIIFSINTNELSIEEVTLELPSLEANTTGAAGQTGNTPV
jgi:phage baseplate assembly protein W